MGKLKYKNEIDWIKLQLSHLISQVLDMIWSFLSSYLVEPSPDYESTSYFAWYLVWFFLKAVAKSVLRSFYLINTKIIIRGFLVISKFFQIIFFYKRWITHKIEIIFTYFINTLIKFQFYIGKILSFELINFWIFLVSMASN